MLEIIDPHEWQYIGAGSANVVFGYYGSDINLKSKVARLRLVKSEISTREIFNYINSPHFSKLKRHIPEMAIEDIDHTNLLLFQSILHHLGLKLQIKLDESNVLIIRNMFSFPIQEYQKVELNKYYKFFIHSSMNEVLFEFKPKWLYTLPEDHRSCRNCITAKLKSQPFVMCHLKLLGDRGDISQWCRNINDAFKAKGVHLDLYKSLHNSMLKNQDLFIAIKTFQEEINIHKRLEFLESENDVDDELSFAMTIRDLSIFIDLNTADAFVVDLDKKSPKKWNTWKQQEMEIRNKYLEDLNFNCGFKTDVGIFIQDP